MERWLRHLVATPLDMTHMQLHGLP